MSMQRRQFVGVRLDPAVIGEVRAVAKANGETVTAVLRRALATGLKFEASAR
jgi:uncharacterized protein (DUF4415 family)